MFDMRTVAEIAGPLKSFVILASFCKHTIYNCRNIYCNQRPDGRISSKSRIAELRRRRARCSYRSMVMRCGASCDRIKYEFLRPVIGGRRLATTEACTLGANLRSRSIALLAALT